MELENLFGIGELAKICGVTPKTLRFYDKLGLLKPALINEQNGYRFYSRWHITRVSTIKQLQETGVSLEQIGTFLGNEKTEDIIDALDRLLMIQQKEIEQQIILLKNKLGNIHLLQSQCANVKDRLKYAEQTGILIREIPEREMIGQTFPYQCLPLPFQKTYQSLVKAVKERAAEGEEFVLSSSPLAVYEIGEGTSGGSVKIGYETSSAGLSPFSKFVIPEGLFACHIFRGSYSELHKSVYQNMYHNIIEQGYSCSNQCIEYYYVNETVTDKNSFLTEIQIPVKLAPDETVVKKVF